MVPNQFMPHLLISRKSKLWVGPQLILQLEHERFLENGSCVDQHLQGGLNHGHVGLDGFFAFEDDLALRFHEEVD